MRVSVHKKLALDENGKTGEDLGGSRGQILVDELKLVVHREGGEIILACQKIVQLGDQCLDFRDEFDQAFRNDDDAEVLLHLGSSDDRVGHGLDDLT